MIWQACLVVLDRPICGWLLDHDTKNFAVVGEGALVSHDDIQSQACCTGLADLNGLGVALVLQ